MEGDRPPRPAFVIRLWLEPTREGSEEWRGFIREVHGHHQAYFRDPSVMAEFIYQHSGVRLCSQRDSEERG